MENIIEPTMDYDFSKLYLGPPSTLAGGAYFTRLMYNTNKNLYIQTPKCLTKQGFIKNGKKIYVDLMFDNNDTIFINWIENLETRCHELIYAKKESWFENNLDKDDIETAFTSPFKIFKSGKYYLLRVNVKPNIKIYDDNDKVILMDNVSPDKHIISILEIQGIKFTSRNFQIEIELKQTMVVSPDPFLDECFIKKPVKKGNDDKLTINDKYINKDKQDNESFIEDPLERIINKSVEDIVKKNDNKLSINLDDDTFTAYDVNNVKDKNNILGLEEADIVLSIEEIEPTKEEKEDPYLLKEVDLSTSLDNNLETIQLKKPNQVYYEIYKKAREKAKEAKKNAILAYLEMKNIKKTYMLDDVDESDSEFDDFESNNNSDISDTESINDDL